MTLKNTTIEGIPQEEKAQDISFGDSLTSFETEADISATCKVFAGDGVVRAEKLTKYIQWSINKDCGCEGHSELALEGDCKCSMSCDCENITIELETSDLKLKENIIIASKPAGIPAEGYFVKILLDTNYAATLDVSGVYPDMEFGDKIYFLNDDNSIAFTWKTPVIHDDLGNKTKGRYYPQEDGSVWLWVEKSFMDSADYPVVVDPTLVEVSNLAVQFGGQLTGFPNNFNGDKHIILFKENGGVNRAYTSPSASDWSSKVAEAGSVNLTSDWVTARIVNFSNGDQLIFNRLTSGTRRIECVLREKDGSWGPLRLPTGEFTNLNGIQYSVTVDKNENVYLMYQLADETKIMLKSEDKGATWVDKTSGGVGLGHDLLGTRGLDAYDMAADGQGNIHAVWRDALNLTGKLYHQVYDIGANSWGSKTQAANSNVERDTVQPGISVACDSNGAVHCLFKEVSTHKQWYTTNESGSWVQKTNTGYTQVNIMIDENDVLIVSENDTTGEISVWNGSSFDVTVLAAGEFLLGFHRSIVTSFGESLWCLTSDFSSSTSVIEDTTYTYPGPAGDSSPPTGVAITSPTNNQTGVSVSPNITCSAGSDATPPISYQFQVDTINTFDSGNLQTSDWQVSNTSWIPPVGLSPLTIYYTRVRARDAVETPNVSAYSAIVLFITEGAADGVSRLLLALSTTIGTNMGFEAGDTSSWTLTVDASSGANATFGVSTTAPNNGLYNGIVTINSHGISPEEIQLNPPATTSNVLSGHFYILIYDSKASSNKTLQTRVTKVGCLDQNLGLADSVNVTTTWQTFGHCFKTTDTTTLQIRFLMGNSGTTVEFDNVYFQETLPLNPNYNYKAALKLSRFDLRTTNQLYTYTFNKWKTWEVPETFVSSYNKSIITSWWQTNQELKLFEDSSNPTIFETVKSINNEAPYQNYVKDYFEQYYTGMLELETVSGK